nr:alpha-latrocrustotoxin-Lt1a isoform X4 [Aegilops tauschii subsp. strangulata]
MPPQRARRGRRHGGNPRTQEDKDQLRVQKLITATLYATTTREKKSIREEAKTMGESEKYVNIFANNPIQGVGVLSYALLEKNNLLATCLLEYLHSDPSSRLHDVAGRTPLHFAARDGNIALMDSLVNTHHVDVNATDNSGLIPLHLAVFYDNTDALLELMRLGATIEGNTCFGKAIHSAAFLGSLGAIKAIHQDFPNECWKFHATYLFLFGTSVDCQNFLAGVSDVGTLPLFTKVALVKTNEAEAHALMKTLLNHGADVNILDQDFLEEPALVIAAKNKWNLVIDLLFDRTEQIAGIEDWTVANLLSHVQTEEFLHQDRLRKANKVQQLRPRIIVELEARNVVVATYLCKALKSDMDEWDWSNISSLCDLCVHFGITSSEYEITVECISTYISAYFSKQQYDKALLAIKACLALEPDNQEFIGLHTMVKRLSEENTASTSGPSQ